MWPSTAPEAPDDQAVVARYANGAIRWIDDAAAHWGCGGISARFDLRASSYQPPYPETTGYSIPTLLAAREILGSATAAKLALAAGSWLLSRQHDDGSMRCDVEKPGTIASEPSKIVIFDSAAILQGFTALARDAEGRRFADAARRLAASLVATEDGRGRWGQHLYFRHYGSHNTLVGYALIRAGIELEIPSATEAGRRCLQTLAERVRPDGFIEGCSFSDSVHDRAFLHPFIYTVEGFLKAHPFLPREGWLEVARPPLKLLLDRFRAMGHVPAAYLGADLTDRATFAALTSIAQLADAWLLGESIGLGLDSRIDARRLLAFLRRRVRVARAPAGVRGGLPSSYPLDGAYGAFTLNNWGPKYFIDASLRELESCVIDNATNAVV